MQLLDIGSAKNYDHNRRGISSYGDQHRNWHWSDNSGIIIIVTTMVIWRRPYNENEENNRSSTISTKPVKEDGMAYLKYLKAKSIAP